MSERWGFTTIFGAIPGSTVVVLALSSEALPEE